MKQPRRIRRKDSPASYDPPRAVDDFEPAKKFIVPALTYFDVINDPPKKRRVEEDGSYRLADGRVMDAETKKPRLLNTPHRQQRKGRPS